MLNNCIEFLSENAAIIIEFAVILAVVIFLFKLLDVANAKAKIRILREGQNKTFVRFVPFFNKLLKALILFFAVATILDTHGHSMTSIIAGFGITGLAVGFAAKETIADFFGSLAILMDKVYDIGDIVVVGDVEGVVEEISIRSTKIRSLDNSIAVIPNSLTANQTVKNFSRCKVRRIDEIIDITYNTPNEKIQLAMNIIKNVLNSDEKINDEFFVFLNSLGESAIKIRMIAYTKTSDWTVFTDIRSNVIFEIIRQFRQAEIDFAFPTNTVYMA